MTERRWRRQQEGGRVVTIAADTSNSLSNSIDRLSLSRIADGQVLQCIEVLEDILDILGGILGFPHRE